MNTSKLFTIAAVSAGLAFGVAAQGKEKENEESISSSDVPKAVQKAADKELKGASIVRWEKEGADYEAVVKKDGKEWGYKFDANGKMIGKHDESREEGKEKGEKSEKY
jgi:YD repeat-containing protein